MTTNPRKSNTGTEDLVRLSEAISNMPGSTPGDAPPPLGGASKPTNGTSRTTPPTEKVGVGSIPPNPDKDKTTIGGTVDLRVNQQKTDLGNTKSRRSRRVQIKPKTPGSTSAPTSTPSESIQPWYPPHFYPPWYPSSFQYPYTTPPAHYPPPTNSRMTYDPPIAKQPTRFRSHAAQPL